METLISNQACVSFKAKNARKFVNPRSKARIFAIVENENDGHHYSCVGSRGEKMVETTCRIAGLGLALCRSIVTAHGGTIGAETCAQHGSALVGRIGATDRRGAGSNPALAPLVFMGTA
jgi:light-regulated signal transduction histidine kinase (bacteriophytochrome)